MPPYLEFLINIQKKKIDNLLCCSKAAVTGTEKFVLSLLASLWIFILFAYLVEVLIFGLYHKCSNSVKMGVGQDYFW